MSEQVSKWFPVGDKTWARTVQTDFGPSEVVRVVRTEDGYVVHAGGPLSSLRVVGTEDLSGALAEADLWLCNNGMDISSVWLGATGCVYTITNRCLWSGDGYVSVDGARVGEAGTLDDALSIIESNGIDTSAVQAVLHEVA